MALRTAGQSLGSLTTDDPGWVGQILALVMKTEAIEQGTASIELALELRSGNVALHNSIKDWDPHMVANHGSYAELVRLSPNRERMSFVHYHFKYIQLST